MLAKNLAFSSLKYLKDPFYYIHIVFLYNTIY